MSLKSLPAEASLRNLKIQAKALLRGVQAGEAGSLSRVAASRPEYPRDAVVGIQLSDAQWVVAREYGFASWGKLKRHAEGLETVRGAVARTRSTWNAASEDARDVMRGRAHRRPEYQNLNPTNDDLSENDAKLLVANGEGYALWPKYDDYMHLDPTVRDVISAVHAGDVGAVCAIVAEDASAADPKWVAGYEPQAFSNDSNPLFRVSRAVFEKDITQAVGGQLTRALLDAGADPDYARGYPLVGSVSFNALDMTRELLAGGPNGSAAVDGINRDGGPMGYAAFLGPPAMVDLLVAHGARLDMRFAAAAGDLAAVQSFVAEDGTLAEDAGALADPFAWENEARGAPVSARSDEETLLQSFCWAAQHGRLDVAAYLLGAGVDVNGAVGFGRGDPLTTLHWCARLRWDGAFGERERLTAAVAFLLDHGADPLAESGHGTPYDWSRNHPSREILRAHMDAHGIVAPRD